MKADICNKLETGRGKIRIGNLIRRNNKDGFFYGSIQEVWRKEGINLFDQEEPKEV